MQVFNLPTYKLYSRPTNFKIYPQKQKLDILDNLLYLITGIIVILWIIGFFLMNINGVIHVLLIIAVNIIILVVIKHQKIKELHQNLKVNWILGLP